MIKRFIFFITNYGGVKFLFVIYVIKTLDSNLID